MVQSCEARAHEGIVMMLPKDLPAADTSLSGRVDGGERTHTPLPMEALSARRSAIDEVGAAIAHDLVEPLTALLLYMHELKWLTESAPGIVPSSAQRVVEGALCETKRVCAVMERIGSSFEAPLESAVARDRDAIRWWSSVNPGSGEPLSTDIRTSIHCLTPREREVLARISGGDTNKEGAQRLRISPRTFESHRAQIMRKLGARNAADLRRMALVEAR
jgi:DNA-binding CsgD family transcriptional regulator